jgi:hypothetical protein
MQLHGSATQAQTKMEAEVNMIGMTSTMKRQAAWSTGYPSFFQTV